MMFNIRGFFQKQTSKRYFYYSLLFVGILICGLLLQFIPQRLTNAPRPLCWYRASSNSTTLEWQINPQPWVANYVKYDLNPQGMDCSYLFLRIKNQSDPNLVSVNVSIDIPYTLTPIAQIPLYYNASRNEYITLFDLAPYWGSTGYLQIRITYHHHESYGGESWNYEYPYNYPQYTNQYTRIPYGVLLPVMAIMCIVLIETIIHKIQPVKQKNLKNLELLGLIQQQEPIVYVRALSQLEQKRNDLSSASKVSINANIIGSKQNQLNFCPYCGVPARLVDGKCGNCGGNLG